MKHQNEQPSSSGFSSAQNGKFPHFKRGENLLDLECLSNGGEGITYTGKDFRDVCVKIFHNFGDHAKKEVEKLLKLKGEHPNIVEIFGTYEGYNSLVPHIINQGYVMELMAGGNLDAVIHSKKEYEAERAYFWMCQIAHAVCFLHMRDIAHLDLKPLNILLDTSLTHVKIGDFGLSKNMKLSKLTGRRTTFFYMAPELADNMNGDSLRKADIYSLGVTFWEILYRKLPFNDKNSWALCQQLEAGVRPSLENFAWEGEVRVLIMRSWAKNPSERCSINDCIDVLDRVLQRKCPDPETPFSPKKLYAAAVIGSTPLHCAAEKGHVDMTKILLQHGAAIDSRDNDLYTPLHLTVQEGHDQVVDATVSGGTPLHFAPLFGYERNVQPIPSDEQGTSSNRQIFDFSHSDEPSSSEVNLRYSFRKPKTIDERDVNDFQFPVFKHGVLNYLKRRDIWSRLFGFESSNQLPSEKSRGFF